MTISKPDFLRIMASAKKSIAPLCLIMLTSATVGMAPAQNVQNVVPTDSVAQKKPLVPATASPYTIVRNDTVDTDGVSLLKRGSVMGGMYFAYQNRLELYHFRDTLAPEQYTDATARNNVASNNHWFKHAGYHELRHAVNSSYMGRVVDQDISLHIANEFWGRVAQGIAACYNMPTIKDGPTYIHVNYAPMPGRNTRAKVGYITRDSVFLEQIRNPNTSYKEREHLLSHMADLSLTFAMETFKRALPYYAPRLNNYNLDKYRRNAQMFPDRILTRAQAMDSMAVFNIEGMPRNMLELASDSVRNRVTEFLGDWMPRHLCLAKLIDQVKATQAAASTATVTNATTPQR